MKSRRRQELKTNELGAYLERVREYAELHAGMMIVLGLLVVAGVGAGIVYGVTSQQAKQADWQAYDNTARDFNPAELLMQQAKNSNWIQDAVLNWDSLRNATRNPEIRARATWMLVEFNLQQAVLAPDVESKKKLLDQAERYSKILQEQNGSNPVFQAAALNALAQIGMDRFLMDRNPQHKTQAEAYLEQIRDNPALLGSPIQTDALARLNAIQSESFWTPIELAEAPLPSAAGETSLPGPTPPVGTINPPAGSTETPAIPEPSSSEPAPEKKPTEPSDHD